MSEGGVPRRTNSPEAGLCPRLPKLTPGPGAPAARLLRPALAPKPCNDMVWDGGLGQATSILPSGRSRDHGNWPGLREGLETGRHTASAGLSPSALRTRTPRASVPGSEVHIVTQQQSAAVTPERTARTLSLDTPPACYTVSPEQTVAVSG